MVQMTEAYGGCPNDEPHANDETLFDAVVRQTKDRRCTYAEESKIERLQLSHLRVLLSRKSDYSSLLSPTYASVWKRRNLVIEELLGLLPHTNILAIA